MRNKLLDSNIQSLETEINGCEEIFLTQHK
jgi:hypothetical protein